MFGCCARLRKRLPSDATEDERSLVLRISSGQRTLRGLRLKIGACMIIFGVLLTLGYEVSFPDHFPKHPGRICVHYSFIDHIFVLLSVVCLRGRMVVLALAPLADDIFVTRLILLTDLVMFVQFIPRWVAKYSHFDEMAWRIGSNTTLDVVVENYCWLLLQVSCVVYCLFTLGMLLLVRDVTRMQRLLWKNLFWILTAAFLVEVLLCIAYQIQCDSFVPLWWDLPASLAFLYFCQNSALRDGCLASLHHAFEARSSRRASASIAGLVGGCPPQEVLRQASLRFRAVHLSSLTYEDIVDNEPNPALSALAFPCKLNDCDAFLSHSWHDDPALKWQALQEWRANFVRVNQREPRVWFDKCCIDQSNIEADLRCLPVFLSGCKQLVLFCGPTYSSRLWCIMELFTYVHIGRSVDEIDFAFLGGDLQRPSPTMRFKEYFENFDARSCECLRQEDRARMLCIIKAAFGSIEAFNEAICQTFSAAEWRQQTTLLDLSSSSQLDVSCSSTTSTDLGCSSSDDEVFETV